MFNSKMKRWEWIIVLILVYVIVVILLAISLMLMEGNMSIEIRYTLLIGYFLLGGWIALRQGRKIGRVRKRVGNRFATIFLWSIGLFAVFSVVCPW